MFLVREKKILARSILFVLLIILLVKGFAIAADMSIEDLQQEIDKKGGLWQASENPKWLLDEEAKKDLTGVELSDGDLELIQMGDVSGGEKGWSSLPKFFDWRDYQGKNYMTPVKDQYTCGSCWAFATVGATEGKINAFYNNPDLDISLSEQDLISCSPAGSCSGGSPNDAFNYIENTGITNDTCLEYGVPPFPYGGLGCGSKCFDWELGAWKVSGHSFEGSHDSDSIKWALINKGPLLTLMEIYSDIYGYGGGIYFPTSTAPEDYEGGHTVVIVGYGVYDGLNYWIVKNSWGDSWGDNGYMEVLSDYVNVTNYYTISVDEPIPPWPYDVQCLDEDNDSYCYWGVGDKPSTGCPVCDNSTWDCDDTDPSVFENCNMFVDGLGSLYVETSPTGADIYVKDVSSGEYFFRGETPLVFQLNQGTRDVKLSKSGYEEFVTTTEIITNQTTNLFAEFFSAPDITVSPEYSKAGVIANLSGFATGINFSYYTIEWGVGENPAIWETSGITLQNGGSSEVTGGRLGTLDTSAMAGYDYVYTIRLNVFMTYGRILSANTTIVTDPDYKQGWPKKTSENISVLPVVVADLSSDGFKEIIAQESNDQESQILTHAYQYDGGELTGWPVSSQPKLVAVPSLGDFENDGSNEIVFVSENSITTRDSHGNILWEDSDPNYIFQSFSVPIIADMDKDGKKEVVVLLRKNMTVGSTINIYSNNGALEWSKNIMSIPILGLSFLLKILAISNKTPTPLAPSSTV